MKKTPTTEAPRAQLHPVIQARNFRHPAVGATEQLVLLVLASRMQTINSEVWPSIATIADDARMSESTARRAVHRLVEARILIEQSTDRRTKTYRLNLSFDVKSAPLQDDTLPCQIDTPPLRVDTPNPVRLTPEEKDEETKEETNEVQPVCAVSASLHADELAILATIEADPTLLLSCRNESPATVAHKLHIASSDMVNVPLKIRSLADWMRSRGKDMSYTWLIQKVADEATKHKSRSPAPTPSIQPTIPDFPRAPRFDPPTASPEDLQKLWGLLCSAKAGQA